MSVYAPHSHRSYGRFSPRFLIVLLCSLVVLAGCGNGAADEEGPRFASDRQPTAVPSENPDASPVTEAISQPAQETPSDEGDMLAVRGAPQFAYFVIDGELQVYDTVSREFTSVGIPAEMIMLDFASSPTGDRVGVLGFVDGGLVVQFFGADGEPLGDANELSLAYHAQASPVASPVATPGASPVITLESPFAPPGLFVTWVPQGNAVVVSGPGVLQRVSMSGVVMPISRAGITGSVMKAFWSPMDSQVAILTQRMDGHQSVFMLESGDAEARELEILNLQPGQILSNLQWLPTGLGVVFVTGNSSNGDLMNGQLYAYQFGDPAPRLLATSGQGGPGGTITHATVSPDGHSVAYAVMVRDQNTWYLHSLWVKPISGGTGIAVPTLTNSPVTDLVWTADGLTWQQEDGSLTAVDASMEPRSLGEEPMATPVASPGATPVIEATPRG